MSTDPRTSRLQDLDHRHVWHPFTPMQAWLDEEPLIVERGEGCLDLLGPRQLPGAALAHFARPRTR